MDRSDMLFVDDESTKDNISGVAHLLRGRLPDFYPEPDPDRFTIDGHRLRNSVPTCTQLVLVGHSLGGLIVRRALCDVAREWVQEGKDPASRPPILDAEARLFSPASAGFRGAGAIGILRAAGVWHGIEAYLSRSSAYVDLQCGSDVLVRTKERTEELARSHTDLDALKARIIWANPDNVVVTEPYDTDWVDDSWNGTTHAKVCKPKRGVFDKPWSFVQTGEA